VPAVLRLDRGAHLTVTASRLPVSQAIAFPLDDGRLLFAIPFGAVTLLGTTEQDHRGGPDDVSATGEDVTYLLQAVRRTFPAAALSPSDIVSTFAGLRPLVRQPGRDLTETSREEAILVSEGGLVTVTGGKLTTHRRIGEKAVDRIATLLARKGVATASSATRRRAFPGAPPSAMPEFIRSVLEECARSNPGLSQETAAHLARRYGSRAPQVLGLTVEDRALGRPLCPGLPDIEAEVLFAAREEDARSLADLFFRRMHLFWQAPDQGEAAMERAGDLLARELGWSREQRQASFDNYSREVARSRDWSTRVKE
jgi:glycerol-3-phosphate dehydrogenase